MAKGSPPAAGSHDPAARPEASPSAEGTRIPRPRRWAVPFSDRMTDEKVAELLTLEPFQRIDPDRFPPKLPLAGVLRNDTKVRSFEKGDIIVREGDYGNSAFLIGLLANQRGGEKRMRRVLSLIQRKKGIPE